MKHRGGRGSGTAAAIIALALSALAGPAAAAGEHAITAEEFRELAAQLHVRNQRWAAIDDE